MYYYYNSFLFKKWEGKPKCHVATSFSFTPRNIISFMSAKTTSRVHYSTLTSKWVIMNFYYYCHFDISDISIVYHYSYLICTFLEIHSKAVLDCFSKTAIQKMFHLSNQKLLYLRIIFIDLLNSFILTLS